MVKKCIALLLALPTLAFSSIKEPHPGFDLIDSKYCITYGDKQAPVQIIEYFSFSCSKCIQLFNTEFQDIKAKYIDTGKVHWTFHPDPADKLTLQAMVCCEPLSSQQKQLLLEGVFAHLKPSNFSVGFHLLQETANFFGHTFKDLDDMQYLQTTDAFESAFNFLKQQPPFKDVPTVEINGALYDTMPTKQFIESKVEELLLAAPEGATS